MTTALRMSATRQPLRSLRRAAKQVEQAFNFNVLLTGFKDVVIATDNEDIHEHWDTTFTFIKGKSVKVDIKGIKMNDPTLNVVELVNVNGDKGWLLGDADYIVFALGGASWKVTGSTGDWKSCFENQGVKVNSFEASNCAFEVFSSSTS